MSAIALLLLLSGASGAGGAAGHAWERTEVRAFVAAGTSDLGGLGRFEPALLGGGNAAGRAGVILQGWWSPRIAFGVRLLAASDTGNIPGLGRTYFYRRALVAETVLTLSVVRLGPLQLVATGGLGVAGILEGADRHYLLDMASRWGEEILSERARIGPTGSIASGVLATAGRLSLSALVRVETIGGADWIDATLVGGTLRTWGVGLTGELGAGMAW